MIRPARKALRFALLPMMLLASCGPHETSFAPPASTVANAARTAAVTGRGTWQEFYIGASFPQGILRRKGGDFWIADGDHSTSISQLQPSGKTTAFGVGTTALEITEDGRGNLWFTTTPYETNILYVTLHPKFGTQTFSTSDDIAGGITLGGDGNVWFVQSSHLGRLAANGKLREYSVPYPQGDTGIAWADGRLWYLGEYLTSLEPRSGKVQTYAPPTGCCGGAIAADAAGTLWYVAKGAYEGGIYVIHFDPKTDQATSYRGPVGFTPYGAPADVALGPDGSVWYCVQRVRGRGYEKRVVGGGFVRFNPNTKRFTTYASPKGYDWNWDLVVARDGRVWSTAGSYVVVLTPQT